MDSTRYGFIENGVSMISFEINGKCINNDCDLYFGFGVDNKYFTLLSAIKGTWATSSNADGKAMGLGIYPNCTQNAVGLASGQVLNIISSPPNQRTDLVGGGDPDEIWTELSPIAGTLGYEWTVNIDIINDDMNDQLIFQYDDGFRDVSCTFDESFVIDQDFNVGIIQDDNDINDIYNISIESNYTPSVTILYPYSIDAFISIMLSPPVSIITSSTNGAEWYLPSDSWMELKLDATKYGFISQAKSIISFKVKGRSNTSDDDILFAFGDETKYMALIMGMTTTVLMIGIKEPIFTFPGCGSSLSYTNITALLNEETNTKHMTEFGNINGWEILEKDDFGTNPYVATITIINDDILDKTTLIYEDTKRSTLCEFNGVFENHHDLFFAVRAVNTDHHAISSIVVDTNYGEPDAVDGILINANSVDDEDVNIELSNTTVIDTGTPKWTITDPVAAKDWSLELTLNGDEYGFVPRRVSAITFEIDGGFVTDDLDLFIGFGVDNKYFSVGIAMLNTIDVVILNGSNRILITSQDGYLLSGDNVGDLFTKSINTNTSGEFIRKALNGGDYYWRFVAEEAHFGDVWPLNFTVINDDRNDQVTVQLSNPAFNVSYQFNDSFLTSSDIQFGLTTDAAEMVDIYSIHLTQSVIEEVIVAANNEDPFIDISLSQNVTINTTKPSWLFPNDEWMELKLRAIDYGFQPNMVSSVAVEINGECARETYPGDCDIWVGFGNEKKLFTMLISMDDSGVGLDNIKSGMFIAPTCGDSLANGNVTYLVRFNGKARDRKLGGDWNNITDLLRANSSNSKGYQARLTIINDDMNKETQWIWEDGRSISCSYNDTFSNYEDLYFQFGADSTGSIDKHIVNYISITSNNTGFEDIFCGDSILNEEFTGYVLQILEESIVRFDSCDSLYNIDITVKDEAFTIIDSCSDCGICHEPSQFTLTLSPGKYTIEATEQHKIYIVCTIPTPTQSPTTLQPTEVPSKYPTWSPITPEPTPADLPFYNVSSKWLSPSIDEVFFLADPYGRFEATVKIRIIDPENVLGISSSCKACFIWQIKEINEPNWNDILIDNNDYISINNSEIDNTDDILSTLTIQSIRRLFSGYCDDKSIEYRLFESDKQYEMRLKIVSNNEEYDDEFISDTLQIETNNLPSNGFCVIENIENLIPLQIFNLFCDSWDDQGDLQYNGLINGVQILSSFVDDARLIKSRAPVGDVAISVLLSYPEYPEAIECFNIYANFKEIEVIINQTNNTAEDFIDLVSEITNSTSFSTNPDVAVSTYTVIDNLYSSNLTSKENATNIVSKIIDNIITTSTVLSTLNENNNKSNTSIGSVITELTTISTVLSNNEIVDTKSTTTLVEDYLPDIFDVIDNEIDKSIDTNDDDNSNDTANIDQSNIQNSLYTVGTQTQAIIKNLESNIAIKSASNNSNISNTNDLSQSLIDYATLSASKALALSNIGESFNYKNTEYGDNGTIISTKYVSATKFETNTKSDELPSCGNKNQNIVLPLTFIQGQNGTFDCVFMSSTVNNFIPSNTSSNSPNSDIVTINLFNSTESIPSLDDILDFKSNECFPYLIQINLGNDSIIDKDAFKLKNSYTFPLCQFWEIDGSSWNTDGCVVYNISDTGNIVTCACTHLTTFSLSEQKFIPKAKTLTDLDWRQLTMDNLMKYPIVWITILSVFIIFIIICYINPRSTVISTKSIMAYEEVIYRSVQEDLLWKDVHGKEIKYISDLMPNDTGNGLKQLLSTKEDRSSICQLSWKLFKVYVRNEHTLLSVFQRTAGTNFSSKQRLGCFFMYLCTIMVLTAMFYEIEQHSITQDIVASFFISLCATLPTLVVKKIFSKSKPIEEKSDKLQKHIRIQDKDEDEDDSKEKENLKSEGDNPEQITTDNYDIAAITKATTNMGDFSNAIQKLHGNKSNEKVRIVNNIREILLNSMYPLSNKCKIVAWIILILWTLSACIIAIVYGLSFDLKYTLKLDYKDNNNLQTNLYDEPCWNNSLQLKLETELDEENVAVKEHELAEWNASGYGGSDSKSWLLSLCQSLLLSLILWQPLTVYVITWLKIWLFSWHLKMNVGPGNVLSLCKRCCCRYNEDDENEEDGDNTDGILSRLRSQLSGAVGLSSKDVDDIKDLDNNGGKRARLRTSSVVAHKKRPLDAISFLGHDEFIIDELFSDNDIDDKEDGKVDVDIELQPAMNKTDEIYRD